MSRFLRIAGRVLAGLLALVVLAYLGNALAAVLDAQEGKRRAVEEARDGLPEAERASAASAQRLREELGLGTPTHAWSELSCAVETNEGGWMVLDYVNACTLTRTELFPAQIAPGPACAHLLALEGAGWPQTAARRGSVRACAPVGDEGPRRPWHPRTRLLSGERPDDLAPTGRWTVVEAPVEVSRTIVGCHRWSVLFCDQPGGLPILP